MYLCTVVCTFAAYLFTQPEPKEPYLYAETVPLNASDPVQGANPTVSCALGRMPYCAHDEDGAWALLGIGFRHNHTDKHMCHVSLFRTSAQRVADAIRNNCVFHLDVDGHRVPARLGVLVDNIPRVYTHFHFDLKYLADGTVGGAKLRQEKAIKYDNGDLGFTFTALWAPDEEDEIGDEWRLYDTKMVVNALFLIGTLAHAVWRAKPTPLPTADNSQLGNGGGNAGGVATNSNVIIHAAHAAAVGVGAHGLVAALVQPSSLRVVLLTAPICGIVSAGTLRRAQTPARLSVSFIAPLLIPLLHPSDDTIDKITLMAGSVVLSSLSFSAEYARMSATTNRVPFTSPRSSIAAAIALSLVPTFAVSPFVLRALQLAWTHAPPVPPPRLAIALYAVCATLSGALCGAFGCGRLAAWCGGALSASHLGIFGLVICARLPAQLPATLTTRNRDVVGTLSCVLFLGGAASSLGCALFHRSRRANACKAAVL